METDFVFAKRVEAAPRLGLGRIATRFEVERFISHMPEMTALSAMELDQLAAGMLVAEAPAGTAVVYCGENGVIPSLMSARKNAATLQDF